jgi:hypothetical protein
MNNPKISLRARLSALPFPAHWILSIGAATLALAAGAQGSQPSGKGHQRAPSAEQAELFLLPSSLWAGRGAAPEAFTLVLPLGGRERTVTFERLLLRTESFRVLAAGPRGELFEVQPPPPRTVRGRVEGAPHAVAVGSLLADGLHLLIRGIDHDLDGDDREALEVRPTGNGAEHRIAPADGVLPEGFCGVSDDAPLEPIGSAVQVQGGIAGTTCTRLIEMAFDADFEFFQSNGSSIAATVADIENVFAGVESVYANELDTPFLVGTIVVRSTSDDPYTTNSASGLLEELAVEWSTELAAVPRDLVHLFTGKNLSGTTIGIAFTPGACLGAGYSLAQSKWSGIYNNRVTVTAHEIGHNLGGQHCNGQPDCGVMCAAVNGCPGGILNFGVFETNQILGFIDSADCLGPLQVTQLAATPGSICTAVEVTFVPAVGAISHTLWRAPSGAGQGSAQPIAFDVSSPYLDAGIPAGQSFQYWVSSIFDDGCESSLSGPVIGFIPSQLSAPSSVIAADNVSCATLGVLWAAVTGNSGYQVWRATTDDSADAIFIADDNGSPYLDDSAVPGVTYRYWVRTKNACGAPGPFGASDLGTRKAAPSPAAPVASDATECAGVEVSWGAVSGASSYALWRGATSDPGAATLVASGVTSPYLDESASSGMQWWYFVQAGNECGQSGLGLGDAGVAGILGDLTGDCQVNGADLGVLLSQWGTDGSADLNGDGIVDGADLGLQTASWTG